VNTPLTAAATIGLERAPSPLAQLPAELQPAPGADPAETFLDAAALTTLAIRSVAGLAEDRWEHAASQPEPDRALPAAARATLRQLLRERAPIQAAAIAVLRTHGAVVPVRDLPELADQAVTPASPLRGVLADACGPTGRWLLARNPRWTVLLRGASSAEDELDGSSGTPWLHGSVDARVAWLIHARTDDPARARATLSEGWTHESAKERAAFVAALRTGLGESDYDFLLSAARDKAPAVARAAVRLLASFPSGAFADARAELIRRHFSVRRSWLGGAILTVSELPGDPAQGILTGAEASVRSFVQSTPLGLWQRVLGAHPAELANMKREGVEWDPVAVFLTAAADQGDLEPVLPLLERAKAPWEIVDSATLSPTWRDHIAARMLTEVEKNPLSAAREWLGEPFPATLADPVVHAITKDPSQLSAHDAAAWLVKLPPDTLPRLRALQPKIPSPAQAAATRSLGHLTLFTRLTQELS
jgi:hypothetical protein